MPHRNREHAVKTLALQHFKVQLTHSGWRNYTVVSTLPNDPSKTALSLEIWHLRWVEGKMMRGTWHEYDTVVYLREGPRSFTARFSTAETGSSVVWWRETYDDEHREPGFSTKLATAFLEGIRSHGVSVRKDG